MVARMDLMPRTRKGFSLIEVVLSLFFVLALVTILLTSSGVLKHSRNANLQSIATRIASREIERLRNLDFLSLPTTEPISDPELSKLPSSYGTRTVSDYSGNVNIKLINIRVNWNEKGTPQELTIETLISKHGI